MCYRTVIHQSLDLLDRRIYLVDRHFSSFYPNSTIPLFYQMELSGSVITIRMGPGSKRGGGALVNETDCSESHSCVNGIWRLPSGYPSYCRRSLPYVFIYRSIYRSAYSSLSHKPPRSCIFQSRGLGIQGSTQEEARRPIQQIRKFSLSLGFLSTYLILSIYLSNTTRVGRLRDTSWVTSRLLLSGITYTNLCTSPPKNHIHIEMSDDYTYSIRKIQPRKIRRPNPGQSTNLSAKPTARKNPPRAGRQTIYLVP